MKSLLALLSIGVVATASAADAKVESIKVHETVQPQYPSSLSRAGVTRGEVRVVISVDENGKLVDAMPILYTKRQFAHEAMSVIRDWKYEPVRINGEAYPGVTEVAFNFKAEGVVVDRTIAEMADAFLKNGFDRQGYELSPSGLSGLDRIPAPKKVVRPAYIIDDKGATEGKVVITFYIDQDGKVRFPTVRGEAPNHFALSAIDAVKQWEFEPPTREGVPVIVRASQEFVFVTKKAN